MIKLIIAAVFIAVIAVMSFWIFQLYSQKIALESNLSEINNKLQPLSEENKRLAQELDYLKNPDNLEKELRSQFNYAKPGEKLIIVAPKE